MDYITFTPETLKKFKKLYEKTEKGGVFLYEGKEVLKEYAGYVIKYVEGKLREKGKEKG